MITKIRTLGLYVGGMVDPDFDWEKACKEAAEAGYTSISVFLTTIFFGRMQPWPLQNGKYLYGQINPDYRAHWRRALTAAAKNGISLHVCAVDQFHDSKYIGPHDNPKSPFATIPVETLYSSWDGQKKNWLWWADDKDPKFQKTSEETLKQYKPIGAFGQAMWNFVAMITRVAAQVKAKFPDAPEPTFKWGNETLAEKVSDVPEKVIPRRHDRNEVDIWFSAMWEVQGFKRNLYFDYVCLDGVGNDKYAYDIMRSVLQDVKKLKCKLEIHGILNVADCLRFGFAQSDLKYVKFSTDGDRNMTGDYPGLGKSSLPDVDLKMDYKRLPASVTTAQEFFDDLMPRYKKYVK